MTDLLVHPSSPASDGTVLSVSPESAGWEYVGFEVLRLSDGAIAERDCGDRELCAVVVSGTANVASEHGDWTGLGGRADPWSGPPEGAYLPPGSHVRVSGDGEVALCWAPAANGGAGARRLPSEGVEVEIRDPLAAHEPMIMTLTNDDMHNVTAYLESLK